MDDLQKFMQGISHDITLFLVNRGLPDTIARQVAKEAAYRAEGPIYEALTTGTARKPRG